MIISIGVLRTLQGLSLLAGILTAMVTAYTKLHKKAPKTVLVVAKRPRLVHHALIT